MKKALSKQEFHNLAMNIVGEELQKEGYEFLAINSGLKKSPQFVTLKNKETSFVIVRAVNSELATTEPENINLKPIIEHAIKHKAKVYYIGVWLGHGNDINQPIINGEEYSFVYTGLVEVKI